MDSAARRYEISVLIGPCSQEEATDLMVEIADFAAKTCSEGTAGYDGMFGVYCGLPEGHDGPHNDGHVEWDFVDPEFRNSKTPPKSEVTS